MFSNWTSYLVTAVISFMVAPIVVHSLGDTGYGLWTLVVSLKLGFGLVALALIGLLLTAIQYSAMAAFAKTLYRPLRVSLRLVDRSSLRDLFSFGVYRFIWIVANQLIFYSDSVVIGMYL